MAVGQAPYSSQAAVKVPADWTFPDAAEFTYRKKLSVALVLGVTVPALAEKVAFALMVMIAERLGAPQVIETPT